MEQFYISVARIAKKTLNHMVAHHTPLLPDLYSKYFYVFLDEVDQEIKEIIDKQDNGGKRELKKQQEATLQLVAAVTEVIEGLDQSAAAHDQSLQRNQQNLQGMEKVVDLVSLRHLISDEINQVRESNVSLKHKLTEAQQQVQQLQSQLSQITNLATIDELTGLYNRRALFSRLVEEHSRVERYQEIFTLLILDIDDFKDVNDQHGHQVGDAILRKLANFIKGSLRTSDFISRFGGEEFIAILPSTSLEQAHQVAEKMRLLLGKKVFETENGTLKIKITVSMGISQCQAGDTVDNLIKRADDALYRAKKSGKNMIATEKDL
ncbi:MAG: GGDEF domain-containing protein [Deltaproteobacteria bacterium]|nr:GGDEF domain-containing protein [Candidatus Anaeroferrophillus wilburensis]MBN2888205.1 GGDEF domain-containing protein [Deltaproteobacteria bacterium]